MRLPTGQRRFSSREVEGRLRAATGTAIRCAIYARVSSEKLAEARKLDLQRERLLAAAAERGFEAAAGVAERAPGLNEKRRGLRRLLRMAAAGEIDGVRVDCKDRLARFGFASVVEALAAHGVRVEVLDGPVAADATQERVQDRLTMVTCFAARLYGSRSQPFRQKVRQAATEAEADLRAPAALAAGARPAVEPAGEPQA